MRVCSCLVRFAFRFVTARYGAFVSSAFADSGAAGGAQLFQPRLRLLDAQPDVGDRFGDECDSLDAVVEEPFERGRLCCEMTARKEQRTAAGGVGVWMPTLVPLDVDRCDPADLSTTLPTSFAEADPRSGSSAPGANHGEVRHGGVTIHQAAGGCWRGRVRHGCHDRWSTQHPSASRSPQRRYHGVCEPPTKGNRATSGDLNVLVCLNGARRISWNIRGRRGLPGAEGRPGGSRSGRRAGRSGATGRPRAGGLRGRRAHRVRRVGRIQGPQGPQGPKGDQGAAAYAFVVPAEVSMQTDPVLIEARTSGF